jgi:hypothetical protein
MKIPYIKVDSAEEYFKLSSKERTWYGLYRVPYSLPISDFRDYLNKNKTLKDRSGWCYWRQEIKKHYPVQYFFRVWISSNDNPVIFWYKKFIGWPIKNAYWNTKRFFNPAFPRWRKTLPKHQWRDISEVVIDSNLNLILDFYYEEFMDGNIDWDSDEKHKTFKEQLITHVNWIEEGRKRLSNDIDDALTEAHNNEAVVDYYERYGEMHRLEKIMYDKETEIVKWFIDNRSFFWS